MDTSLIKMIVFGTIVFLISNLFVFIVSKRSFKAIIKTDRITGLTSIIAAMVGIMTVIISIASGDNKNLFKTKNDILKERIDYLEGENTNLKASILKIENSIANIDNIDSLRNYSGADQEIQIIKNKIDDLDSKIIAFEGLILTKAENLITLPLLKKDIEKINIEISNVKQTINSQSTLFEELQNQGRWLIGTLGLGILALIVPMIRSNLGKKENDKE